VLLRLVLLLILVQCLQSRPTPTCVSILARESAVHGHAQRDFFIPCRAPAQCPEHLGASAARSLWRWLTG
jgi:hypothetical protein